MNSERTFRVFISYSWESKDHKDWVRILAEKLRGYGIDARLDQWYVKAGQSFTEFMEREVEIADYVIVVCTPTFASKSNSRSGGVGYEQQIISGKIFHGIDRSRFIPILRSGELTGRSCAIPSHFTGTAAIDFREDSNYDNKLEELIRIIFDKPKFAPPPLGQIPILNTHINSKNLVNAKSNVVNNKRKKSSSSGIKEKGVIKYFNLESAFGFIQTNRYPKDFFVHKNEIHDKKPLFKGTEVEFITGTNERGLVAFQVKRLSPIALPTSENMFDWADFGDISKMLLYLSSKALEEKWKYNIEVDKTNTQLPILHNYLTKTFERLVLESQSKDNKISQSQDGSYAAFNTGLVNKHYKSIFALFTPNTEWGPYWKLKDFCSEGERGLGQIITTHFNPTPQPAHYFHDPANLIYDSRKSKPVLSSDHIIIDNTDRFPVAFWEKNAPPGFTLMDTSIMTKEERTTYFTNLGAAIENNAHTYRAIEKRLNDALDLAIQRVTWNYKTAIPQFDISTQKLQFLLPLCLVSDESVDLALAVDKTKSGAYLGHTVLPLDLAYERARLVCRPDSDWLHPDLITETTE